MRSTKLFFFAMLLIAALMFYPSAAWAPTPCHMELEGATQGKIEGFCKMKGREGTILVYAFSHDIHIPCDPQSGQPSGKRIHGTFEIQKEIDKTSPMLYHALCTGERLRYVKIKFYRYGLDGRQENWFTVVLEDAIIVRMTSSMPTGFLEENKHFTHIETVHFAYRSITWIHETDGIQSEDDWRSPAS